MYAGRISLQKHVYKEPAAKARVNEMILAVVARDIVFSPQIPEDYTKWLRSFLPNSLST